MGAVRVAAAVSFILIIVTVIAACFGERIFFNIQFQHAFLSDVPLLLILSLLTSFFLWILWPLAWYGHVGVSGLVLINLAMHCFQLYSASEWISAVVIFAIWLLVFILLLKNHPNQWASLNQSKAIPDTPETDNSIIQQQSVKRGYIGPLEAGCIVVIALVLLCMVILPIYVRSRAQGRTRGCMANLKELMTAVDMYVQDHNGRYPGQRWADALRSYNVTVEQLICPSDAWGDRMPISYGLNSLLVRADDSGIQSSLIHMPAQVGMLTDCWPHDFREVGGSLITRDKRTDAKGRSVSSLPDPRHNGINILYCDGHVAFIKGKVIPTNDPKHPVYTAFFRAEELGYIVPSPSHGGLW